MEFSSVAAAFFLTLAAGLSTGIGGLSILFSRKPSTSFLALALGFSAGVMLYVSFIEIFPSASTALSAVFEPKVSSAWTVAAFFIGMAFIMLIDFLIPEEKNPHEPKDADDFASSVSRKGLLRVGLSTALAIAVHNFPEGLATFMSSVHDPQLGVSVAFAIAVHNIPEGIAVAVPVYYATRNRKKAFFLSLFSGLAEPLGGLLGFALISLFALHTAAASVVFGAVFAAVAGIMVYISLDELLPTAEKYGRHHFVLAGVIGGMAVMAVSLLLF